VTPVQIVAVCLRFLAIVWLLHTLNSAYGAVSYLQTGSVPEGASAVVWIQAGLQLAICGALWFFPVTFASKLLPSYAKPPDPEDPPRLVEWQTLGVICIGLWALSRAVPDLAYWVTYMGMAFESDSPMYELMAEQKASVISTVVEIGIGAWLILGAKGFAALLFKIRTAGISK
jgi:hypothetical protein